MYVGTNKPNSDLKQITFSTTPEFKNTTGKTPEVITFKAEDGTNVYARLYQPKVENKNKAAVIFVHGAGYLQTHTIIGARITENTCFTNVTDLGYTVLDIDYRASGDGYGRDFRTEFTVTWAEKIYQIN